MKTKTAKTFDAVEESRKWKSEAAAKLLGCKTAREMQAVLNETIKKHHEELGIDLSCVQDN